MKTTTNKKNEHTTTDWWWLNDPYDFLTQKGLKAEENNQMTIMGMRHNFEMTGSEAIRKETAGSE
jgi:hypothetical protein